MTNTISSEQETLPEFTWQLPDSLNRVTLVGVGLIGGSIGLALRQQGFSGEILGLGRRPLDDAVECGAVDAYTQDAEEAARGAGLVVLCTPVELIAPKVAQLTPYLEPGCIVTDVGSVKRTVVTEVEPLVPEGCYFVGGHPMAGSEQTGVAAARHDLFHRATCLITPTEQTNADALARVERFWSSIGARVVQMSPLEHDYLIGAASHLPHLVACALTQTVAKIENEAGKAIDFAATGFRDTTRIAAGSPNLWTHILLQNRDAVLRTMEEMLDYLQRYHHALSHANPEELRMLLKNACFWRESMEKGTHR